MISVVQKMSLVGAIGLALFCVSTQATFAATVYINSDTGNDSTGDGTSGAPYKTFHKGYTEASANDTLDLTGTFTWTDADETGDSANTGYTIAKNLIIQGQSAPDTIIQAHSSDNSADRRVFTISSGVTATIQDLTIRYGKTTSSSYYGAGIENLGTLTVDRSTLNYNRATGAGGGGISNEGTLTVRNSTIHNNVVYYMGGGLLNHYDNPAATMDISNTTVAFNQQTATVAYTEGAGVFYRRGSGSVTNSTIAYNTGLSTVGLGLGDAGSTVYIKNTIIVGNTGNNEVGFRSSNNGTIVESGYNIFGKRSPYFTSSENNTWLDQDQDGTYTKNGDASTGTLSLSNTLADNSTDYGTQTFAITDESSIAVNGGDDADHNSLSVPTLDQRGFTRSGAVDIGAFEFGGTSGAEPSPTPTPTPTSTPTGGPTATPTPTPSETSSGNSITSRSAGVHTPQCEDTTPVSAPDLFQINRQSTSAKLHFSPVARAEKYHVIFGYNRGDARFGVVGAEVTADSNTGVQSITIDHLDPATSYWFTVAPVNGCAVGEWSNWLEASSDRNSSIFYRWM